MNMVLMMNRELTNETASPKNLILDVKSKDFTREGAQAISSISKIYNLIDRINKFDFTHSKKENKFSQEYQQWGLNKKIVDIISGQDKSPQTFKLLEKRLEITTPGNIRFKQ